MALNKLYIEEEISTLTISGENNAKKIEEMIKKLGYENFKLISIQNPTNNILENNILKEYEINYICNDYIIAEKFIKKYNNGIISFDITNVELTENIIRMINKNIVTCYLFIDLKKFNTNELKFLYTNISIPIIIDFKNFKFNSKNLYKYSKVCDLVSKYENMYLSLNNWKTKDLLEHPCLLYSCDGNKCHLKRSNKLRNIYVDKYCEFYYFTDASLLKYSPKETYEDTLDNNFNVELFRKIYMEIVLNYPYKYFPIVSILNFYLKRVEL